MHVLNANKFLVKTRKIIDGLDLTPFEGVPVEKLQEILPMGEDKENSMILMVYILMSRSQTKPASLVMEIIHSGIDILHALDRMIEREEWPKSFNGVNQIKFVTRKEDEFLHQYISTITQYPSMRLVSAKVSSPIVSIFQVLKHI